MKVAELRSQGWIAIQGDVLTNGLSDRIVLSEGGAISVNEGHHDDLEIVDLLWRNDNDQECEFSGMTEHSLDGWRPYFGPLSSADKLAIASYKNPVFTQAMADNGDLPPVGSKCLAMVDSSNKFKKYIVMYIANCGSMVLRRIESEIDLIVDTDSCDFKPIDTSATFKNHIDKTAILIENGPRVCEVSDEHVKIVIEALLLASLIN